MKESDIRHTVFIEMGRVIRGKYLAYSVFLVSAPRCSTDGQLGVVKGARFLTMLRSEKGC